MLGFGRTNSTKHTKILRSENFVLTNMNIVCYSLCMNFGLRPVRWIKTIMRRKSLERVTSRGVSRQQGSRDWFPCKGCTCCFFFCGFVRRAGTEYAAHLLKEGEIP